MIKNTQSTDCFRLVYVDCYSPLASLFQGFSASKGLSVVSPQPGFVDQAYAFRGFNHFIKGRMQKVQCSSKWSIFEMTLPHEQGKFLRGLPCM